MGVGSPWWHVTIWRDYHLGDNLILLCPLLPWLSSTPPYKVNILFVFCGKNIFCIDLLIFDTITQTRNVKRKPLLSDFEVEEGERQSTWGWGRLRTPVIDNIHNNNLHSITNKATVKNWIQKYKMNMEFLLHNIFLRCWRIPNIHFIRPNKRTN